MNARHAKLHFTGQLSLHKDSSDIWNWHLRLTPSLRRRQRKLKFIRQLKLHTSCRQHKSDEITTNYTKNLLINILTFFFLQLYRSMGISPVIAFRRRKPAATESRYPTYGACWIFYYFHNPPNSDMDYGIFNVRAYVNACNCTRGCSDRVRAVSYTHLRAHET